MFSVTEVPACEMIYQGNQKIFNLILNIMKKLGKLEINPEKIMKNEELLTLRGGFGCCTCTNGYAMAASSSDECEDFCNDLQGQHGVWGC